MIMLLKDFIMNNFNKVVLHHYDAITRRAVFRNLESTDSTLETNSSGQINQISKVIQKASSLTIDFESPSLPFHLVQLSGRQIHLS